MERMFFPVTRREAERSGIPYSSEANKNALFPSQLRELRKEKGVSQDTLSKALGVSKSTVGLWETGDTLPDAKAICDLAKYYGVSTDYLLGRTTVKAPDYAVQYICEYTGLSECAVETLRYFNFWVDGDYLIPTINLLIEQEELSPDHDVDFCYDTDNPTSQEEADYKQQWEEWENKGLVPILSVIDNFFSIGKNPESIYDLCVTGELLKGQSKYCLKGHRFESIRKILASDIIERVLLSDIEDGLKKLKEKESGDNAERKTT